MEKIAFAGTFDPITKGHLWVIEEGLNIANHVVVMIAQNSTKKTLFSEKQRKKMIEDVLLEKGIQDRVSVVLIKNEYAAQSAIYLGCEYLIRGIRSAIDFDYESLIQKTNTDVLYGAKTLFVMPPRDLESVSSSFVKSLVGPVGWHWHVKNFLDKAVYNAWIKQYIIQTADSYLKDNELNDVVRNNLYNEVFHAYTQNNRHYHNLEHIAHGLQEIHWLVSNYQIQAIDAQNLVLAFLLHDIVQQAQATQSDEQLSVNIAGNLLQNYQFLSVVKNLILSTGHFTNKDKENSELENLMISIDLAILAQNPVIYHDYVTSVRKEYEHIDNDLWKKGRLEALTKLLEKDKLYPSQFFRHYELRARKNLQDELISLNK